MAKEAYYFSHDSNAQDDPKCMLLIDQLGMEGYGIFWALIERLRAESSYSLPINICNAFAKRWGTSKEKIEAVIKNYDLFKIENDFFFSDRLKTSMVMKSEKARESANYRWKNANALRLQYDGNANGMRNDAIKVKERKENKENVGFCFSADKLSVIFPDNTEQRLGESQLHELKNGRLLPKMVVKGNIY
jgi:hypothetical protein